jgi:MFS family permease
MTRATGNLASRPAALTSPLPDRRPSLLSRALLLRCLSVIGSSISFYLLLAAVPVFAASAGGNAAAGMVTGALLIASVAGELLAEPLAARFGYRAVLALGLLLLGGPALALPATTTLPGIVSVCAARGVGFGLAVVAGGALTAALLPAERRGEGLALVGFVGGVPAMLSLPLGLWLSAHAGYPVVFGTAALAALAAAVSVSGLPAQNRRPRRDAQRGPGADLARLMGPTLIFAGTTAAAGVLVTFLPLAGVHGPATVETALLTQAATAMLGRWIAGRHGDRHGPARLLAPGVLLAGLGLPTVAFTASPTAVLTGAALFGLGFGITQNASLTVMYARAPVSAYGTVSTLWNLAYDAGMGAGAVGFGLLIPHTGYPLAFACAAIPVLAAAALGPACSHRVRRDPLTDRTGGSYRRPHLEEQAA